MIEPMARACVVAHREEREALLGALRELSVLHLVPARPDKEGDERELTETLSRTRQALRLLREITPAGEPPPGTVTEVVEEALEVERRNREARSRLLSLQAEARDVAIWGSVTRERIAKLGRQGARVRVLAVPNSEVSRLPRLFIPLRPLGDGSTLVAWLGGIETILPPGATVLTPPERGQPEVERDIAEIQATLAASPARLARLALRRGDLEKLIRSIEDRLALDRALRSGLDGDRLYGVEGWLPAARAGALAGELQAVGIAAAVRVRPAAPDERPPTLVRYPRLLRPIRSLFDLLGVRPGYDEADPSAFFMVAVPLFAGMLIADAGYGLVFLLLSLVARRFFRSRMGTDAPELVMLFGGMALVWGTVSGSWFGVTPQAMLEAGGWPAHLGGLLQDVQLIRGSEQETRDTLIKVSFLVGSVHLVLAHLRRVVALAPDRRALADVGWCGVLGAMLGVIWTLFFRDAPLPGSLVRALLGAGVLGFALVVVFSAPGSNFFVRAAKGLGGALFPLIGAFGDTLSYIRLAAVGLASFYLAVAIDSLAAQAAAGTWLAALPILLVGHSLNMTLSLVAILAHGVRLNLLEFSSHSGLQWAGYPYRPLAVRGATEH
jgi:V/A-type H+-transporting ATPase subunit I